MSIVTYLTPGPSELFYTVEQHTREALRHKLLSISHRSQEFKDIYAHTVTQLRVLLNIPEDYQVVFTASANEVWERLLQNCVEKHAFFYVNGAFSGKIYDFAKRLGLEAHKQEVPWGEGFDTTSSALPENCELIALPLNETSTGVQLPLTDVRYLRKNHPDKLLAIDATSALPAMDFPIAEADAIYFSVQKAFGLPAGLGVWIVSPACLQKAEALEAKGKVTGTYHRLTHLLKRGRDFQTPETPNMLGIYLLGKVCQDMNQKGKEQLLRETTYKSTFLYHAIENNNYLAPFVTNLKWCSPTVVVADIQQSAPDSNWWIDHFRKQGIVVGAGYGKMKSRQLRIANFPTHSKETIEYFGDLLSKVTP